LVGELEVMDVGRCYRISEADLQAFIDRCKRRRENIDDEEMD
jgi:hypothetical protein